VDLIAEFFLIFILMKISANVVYYYTSYVVCYKIVVAFFIKKKKIGLKKIFLHFFDGFEISIAFSIL
jgi:hypothetical protein